MRKQDEELKRRNKHRKIQNTKFEEEQRNCCHNVSVICSFLGDLGYNCCREVLGLMYSFTLQNERVVWVESMVWAVGGKIAISWNMPYKQHSRRQIEYFVKKVMLAMEFFHCYNPCKMKKVHFIILENMALISHMGLLLCYVSF